MAGKALCPVQNCKHKSYSTDLLINHFMRGHNKIQLATTIIVLMDLAEDLNTQLKDLKWKFRPHV